MPSLSQLTSHQEIPANIPDSFLTPSQDPKFLFTHGSFFQVPPSRTLACLLAISQFYSFTAYRILCHHSILGLQRDILKRKMTWRLKGSGETFMILFCYVVTPSSLPCTPCCSQTMFLVSSFKWEATWGTAPQHDLSQAMRHCHSIHINMGGGNQACELPWIQSKGEMDAGPISELWRCPTIYRGTSTQRQDQATQ